MLPTNRQSGHLAGGPPSPPFFLPFFGYETRQSAENRGERPRMETKESTPKTPKRCENPVVIAAKESGPAETVWEIAEPIAEELGFEIVDLELRGSSRQTLIRVYLDSLAGTGVTIDDCAEVSRRLTDAMDAEPVLAEGYMLEVSSPGVNRPLRRARHFVQASGERVRVRLRAPLDGRKQVFGRLTQVGEDSVTVIEDDQSETTIAFADMTKANVEFEFEAPKKPKKGSTRKEPCSKEN